MIASEAQQITAYSTFIATIGLVLTRPRLSGNFRLSPVLAAGAGVLVFLGAGLLAFDEFATALRILAAPLTTIASIMILSAAAERAGVFGFFADFAERGCAGHAAKLFRRVFILAALCSAILNNDTTMLMFTPVVIALVRRRFPENPELLVPFAFAVFMACGGAPFMISNPMNMIVASIAQLGFNEYAVRMIPISFVACLTSYFCLNLIYGKLLRTVPANAMVISPREQQSSGKPMLILLMLVLAVYPLAAFFSMPIWPVALSAAVMAMILVKRNAHCRPLELVRDGVSWRTLIFLFAVFLLGAGLRNAGIVALVARLYQGAGIFTVGGVSALGSALMDNHPMAIINVMALGGPSADFKKILAALIGGDLGPRLLPMGSLAGLIWMAQLERAGIHVKVNRFFRVGAAVMIPTLAVTLAVLAVLFAFWPH